MKYIIKIFPYFVIITVIVHTHSAIGRHPFRLPNPDFPIILARSDSNTETYSLRSPYVRLHPLFTFKTEDFTEYLLPERINYLDNPEQHMHRADLSRLIEEAVHEIKQRKKNIKKNKQLKHFKVLQHKNFNYKKSCGLIVLKFHDYPLVVKLFIEHPSTFLNFHATGLEPTFFFYMGGGANRHLSGFTRIKNRIAMINKVNQLDRWRNYIFFPRKWFWLPRNQENILLCAHNLAGHDTIQTTIPGVYAIIADEVDMEKDVIEIPHKIKSKMIMQLCNDLDMFIDPHEKNYVFSKSEQSDRFKITIVDTEHFPTMVGILQEKSFRNHSHWYAYLAGKCLHDVYLQTKRDLLHAQNKVSTLALM